jgi:hypothetical protein
VGVGDEMKDAEKARIDSMYNRVHAVTLSFFSLVLSYTDIKLTHSLQLSDPHATHFVF